MAKTTKKAAKKAAKKPAKAKKESAPKEEVVENTSETTTKKAAKKSGKKNSFATFDEVKELIAATDAEFVKFDNGTKAAGRRIRKNAMLIKKAMGVLRSQISEEVSSM